MSAVCVGAYLAYILYNLTIAGLHGLEARLIRQAKPEIQPYGTGGLVGAECFDEDEREPIRADHRI